jgi:hypothetical protein
VEEFRHGALYVLRDRPNAESIQRALRDIDRRLFLEKQITYENDAVWCVVCDIGSGQPPVTPTSTARRSRSRSAPGSSSGCSGWNGTRAGS